ncbi:MAG: dockerin type I domain-containing protein, partial [Candidatus Thorarchaeota archaeon]
EKYGYIIAVFQKVIFTITALVAQDAPNGTIETYGDGTATPVNGGLIVSVGIGGSQTFNFSPFADNHVSAIQVDGTFIKYNLTYTFTNVQADHTLTVYFSTDGQAYVPIGSNVPVYLGDNVGLNFTSINEGGTATQANVLSLLLPQLQGTSLILWDVSVGATFTGLVEVTLPYEGATIANVWTSDSLDALYSDVNADGVVNGDDVSDVAVGIKTTVSSGAEYNPQFDINRDGELTEADVHLVNEYKGTTLQSLTFWIEGDSLFIETDHFSIFRGR